ncbi:MAG: type II secretion system major pseudopilin GspG [bacterium]
MRATLRRRLAARQKQRGMTLLEIMIVIAILGLLASVIVVAVMNQFDNAKVNAAKLKLNELEKALQLYSVQVGEYPSQNEGLRALLQPPDGSKPFLKEKNVPKDPWGAEYLYFNPARGGGNAAYEVVSKGPDGQEGTEDDIKPGGK